MRYENVILGMFLGNGIKLEPTFNELNGKVGGMGRMGVHSWAIFLLRKDIWPKVSKACTSEMLTCAWEEP